MRYFANKADRIDFVIRDTIYRFGWYHPICYLVNMINLQSFVTTILYLYLKYVFLDHRFLDHRLHLLN